MCSVCAFPTENFILRLAAGAWLNFTCAMPAREKAEGMPKLLAAHVHALLVQTGLAKTAKKFESEFGSEVRRAEPPRPSPRAPRPPRCCARVAAAAGPAAAGTRARRAPGGR